MTARHDRLDDIGPYLSPAQVGKLLAVSPKTVTRWAKDGKIPCIRTVGGHRRFAASDIIDIIDTHEDMEAANECG